VRVPFTIALVAILAMRYTAPSAKADELPFIQHQNIVYAEVHGVGLLMDVFVPTSNKNGLGLVDVVSGAWYSDRGKIRDQALAQTFHILCRKGYTVFAIRPGSISKFGASEMLAHLNQGIRWVKDHSREYAIDPDRLGMMGASAGGHLACLAAVTAEEEKPRAWYASRTHGTRVKAVAVFFPPTDFFQYGDKVISVRNDDRLGRLVRRLAFPQGLNGESDEQLNQRVTQISPARLVTAKTPPFLIIHGDADPLVPLQQSEVLLEALKKAEVPAELIVKKGGTHPWLTIHEEVALVADWFDKRLAK
jgi:acetyl esterase/lipase